MQSSPLIQSKQKITPLINLSELINKSPQEIDKIYGKPSTIDKKSVQLKDGNFRVYDKSGKRFLQVDFYKNKAVAFYLEILNVETKNPEDAVKLCGFDLKIESAKTEQLGFWWDRNAAIMPFYNVKILKFSKDGNYVTCEAHIEI